MWHWSWLDVILALTKCLATQVLALYLMSKKITLANDSVFDCPTYFVLQILHSKQRIRLMPCILVLCLILSCRLIIVPDCKILVNIDMYEGLLHSSGDFVIGLDTEPWPFYPLRRVVSYEPQLLSFGISPLWPWFCPDQTKSLWRSFEMGDYLHCM